MSNTAKIIWLFGAALIILGLGSLYFYQQDQKLGELTIDAGPADSETHFLMTQVAEVVERNSTKLRLNVVTSPPLLQGQTARFRDGVDLITVLSNTSPLPETSLVAVLYEEVFQIITRVDTGIRDVHDLDGKRLALPLYGTSELAFFWAIGDHYDLFVQNVEWQSMTEFEAIDALLNQEVDALFFVGTKRNRATLKLIEDFELRPNAPDLRMLPIDQAPAMGVKRPYIETFFLEKGTFDGAPPLPRERLITGAVRRTLVARSAASVELVAELTRVLFENRFDLLIRFPLANRIEMPDINAGLGMPLHEGADQYYRRDEPSFIVENAEPLALVVTVIAMLSSTLFALRSHFIATQKNVADHFNKNLLALGEEISSAEDSTVLEDLRQRLKDDLNVVVDALDIDRVTDEGFQSYAFLWQTVERQLDEKLASLATAKPDYSKEQEAAE